MAKQTLVGMMQLPPVLELPNASAGSSVLLDAIDERLAFIFKAPQTAEVRKVGFRTGTVTNGATLDIRMETVDATTGLPTGTLVTTNTSATQVIANNDDNTWFTVTLTADAPLTAETDYAFVIKSPSSSPGNLNIVVQYTTAFNAWGGPPYLATDLGGAGWSKTTTIPPYVFYIEYDDGTTDFVGAFPASSMTSTSYNNTSATRERALYFQLPVPVSVTGCMVYMALPSGNFDVILYDSDGSSELRNISFDKDINRGNGPIWVRFASKADLLANTFYRLSLKPTSASNVSLLEATFASTTIMAATTLGSNAYLSTRDSGGVWTESGLTTQRPIMALLANAFDDGASAGARPEFRESNL